MPGPQLGRALLGTLALIAATASAEAAASYQVFVSNERSGDITVIDGGDFKVLGTYPVGKRPRGIHVSPDGKTVYVAVSGTPIEGPPPLDAAGNPILKKNQADDDDDDKVKADKSADGIVVFDVARKKAIGRVPAGSDPEEFALSKDGSRIYVSNEDIKTASVINIGTGKVEHIIPVGREPEGVGVTPDGKQFYVTCETGGEVFVIDTSSYSVVGHFTVPIRPRSVDFLPDGKIGFIPSESKGELNIIDTSVPKVIQTIDLPAGSRPMKVKVSLDGSKVYVSDGRAGTVSVLDTKGYSVLATVKVGARPWGIVLSPDGKYLFSANGPSNDVSVVDLATNKEITRVKAGEGPWGLTIVPRR
ncbi:MAG TPA: beta-propeller fold lactonase family protein [Steroidobacteraceae bacterium]|nr:beta-propeller fold lactonase family protein [Steroidobacteraceae bacterium]